MISAIILSAGEGKRIGFNKALLDWGGEKLINYQIKSLSHKDITERIVVIGSESEKVKKTIKGIIQTVRDMTIPIAMPT